MIRIIIAGGRDFNDYDKAVESFKLLLSDLKKDFDTSKTNIEIVSGGANGADRIGEKFAKKNKVELIRFLANWDKYGKSAGYIRNKEMAEYAKELDNIGVLLAFWDGKSKGTKHMIDLSKSCGLINKVVEY